MQSACSRKLTARARFVRASRMTTTVGRAAGPRTSYRNGDMPRVRLASITCAGDEAGAQVCVCAFMSHQTLFLLAHSSTPARVRPAASGAAQSRSTQSAGGVPLPQAADTAASSCACASRRATSRWLASSALRRSSSRRRAAMASPASRIRCCSASAAALSRAARSWFSRPICAHRSRRAASSAARACICAAIRLARVCSGVSQPCSARAETTAPARAAASLTVLPPPGRVPQQPSQARSGALWPGCGSEYPAGAAATHLWQPFAPPAE